MLAIAPVAGLLVRDGSNKRSYFIAVALIVGFVAWTGTRGGSLGLALGTSFAIMATPRFTTLRNLGILIASCTTGLLLSIAAFHPAPQFGLFRMVATVSTDDASSGRVSMWIDTLTEITTSPFFGFGSGRFRESMLKYGFENNHPHNFVLQYIYDWGIIGGTAALIALAWLGMQLFQFKNQVSMTRFLSLSGFIGTLGVAMVEGTLFHPLPMLIGIALIAPALGSVRKHDE
jgi:O-antigen ligase